MNNSTPHEWKPVTLEELNNLSLIEIDDMLERIAAVKSFIASKQSTFEAFEAHYIDKIEKARQQFEDETRSARGEIEAITARLERYAKTNVTGSKRSLVFPSGTLRLTKQSTLFFVDGSPAASDNPALIEFAEKMDDDLIKVKTVKTADWAELKKRLAVDDMGTVYLRDTGEVVNEITAQIRPDKFEVITE